MRHFRSSLLRGMVNFNAYFIFSFLLIGVFTVSEVKGQQYVQIGDGTLVTGTNTASPINIWYRSLHGQVNYTKAELNAAGFFGGAISELGFYVEQAPSYSLPNYSIGMSTTTEGDTSTYNAGPFTIVYTNSSYTPTAGGFDMLTLDEPFYWDGISNVLIDLCFDPVPDYASSGTVRYYEADYGFRYIRSDGSSQCGQPTISFTSQKPQLQLLVAGSAENDAGIGGLNAPINFCAGSQDIIVEVRNFGANIIDSVQVNWTFDNVLQPSILLTNPLDTFGGLGAQSASVTLGNKTFVNGNSYDLEVWTAMPNSVQDTVSTNDTLRTVLQPLLDGTYTIGGIAPDYATISEAVADLNTYGVCAPVTFNIRDGFYDEQFSINQFLGSSCDIPVIFQSETGDSTGVIINDVTDVFSSNYIVELNGADGVIFSGLSFVGGGSYARTVYIRGGSNCNTFQNCVFEGSAVSSSSSNYALVATEENTTNYYNKFTNSVFKNGSTALNMFGDYDPGDFANNADTASVEISNNLFEGQYSRHIHLTYYGGARVVDNVFNTNSTSSSWNSIYINNTSGGVEVSGNQLIALRGNGISFSGSSGTTTQRNLIANNFVTMSGTYSNTRGIYVYYSENTDIYHNNVNVTTVQDQAAALYAAYHLNMNVLNNCLVNTGGGYAVYYEGINNSVSDYNNYYQTGTYLGNYSGTLISDLTAWQGANGQDANSISTQPFYVSDADLHVATIDLNAAGTPVADVLYDIDGELRDAATPDIGADEFSPPPNDAGVLHITPPGIPFPAGTYPIYATLKNYGNDELQSADLYWTVNDSLQAVVNWTGTLSSGDTLSVLLGDLAIDNGEAYSLVSWTTLPNGIADIINSNDTTDVVDVYAGLGGTYTLGGTSPDFTDFASVEDALNFGGVYAPVIINVRDGVYNEQIHLTEITGADATNNVAFQSENGDSTSVVIEFSPNSTDNYVWLLDNADYVTIKGMTLRSLNSSYANVVVLENEANNNVIENNYFDGNSIYGYLIYSTNTALNENNTIRNNFLEDGRYGIYLTSSFNLDKESGNIIHGNKLENQSREAIYLAYQSGVIVENNQIGSFTENSTYAGIYLYYSDDAHQIIGNTIISNSRYYGLRVEYCAGTLGNEGLIANNFISLLRTSNTANGIYNYSGSYQNFYNNTVNVQSSTLTSSVAFYASYGQNLDLRNNIFSNKGGGYTVYMANNTPITNSDNNDFYTTGPNVAYSVNTPVATLADWQTATGFDAASLSVDPFFESDSTYIITQVSLNGAAQPLAQVTTDIEGQTRAAMPDIGAYEFVPPAVDAGVIAIGVLEAPFAAGDQLVKAILKNYGADTITSVVFDWELNGLAQAPVTWTGMLASGDTLEVGLDIVNFELIEPYSFKAWTSLPNTLADLTVVNDTASINDLYAGLGGSYTLGGTTPDFANFAEAATVLSYGGVYAPVDIQVRDGVYSEKVELFEIPGADTLNQVIIESENDDPALVTLSSVTSSSANYILYLNGTDWLTVNGMTIETLTNSTYARVVLIENDASHNTFSNNRIASTPTSSTLLSRTVIYVSNAGANEYNSFVNNIISNGSRGLSIYGNYNNGLYIRGNYLIGNQFENQYYAGVYMQGNLSDVLIADNMITSNNTTASDYYGLYMYNLKSNISVLRNQILNVPSNGIYSRDVVSQWNAQSYIVNNFIQINDNGTSPANGIYTYNGNYQNFYHNTVSINSTNSLSRAFYNRNGSNKKVVNNIFSNTGGGYCYFNYSASGITVSDYNNFYTTGPYIGYWNGNQATLAEWQAVSIYPLDDNSISLDPIFASETDLHVSNVLMDRLGTPIPEVTEDIDGDARSTQFPDIGADEFSASNNDAGIYAINSPTIPFAEGNQPIYVAMINNGIDTLGTANIGWQINEEVQPTFPWTGVLPPGQQRDSILLGNYVFERDTLYEITIWTSMPNGVVDTETYNDTLQLNDVYAALSGAYTIGGTSPDFQNFTEAVAALERGGIAGEVIFNVRSGIYNEQLNITEIIGADAQNTITFQSELGDSTQVELTFGTPTFADNYVVQLDSADWISFKQMTFRANESTSNGRLVSLINGADNNVFSNIAFIGRDIALTSDEYALIYSTGEIPNTNNTFVNNYFQDGSHGIHYDNGNVSFKHTILISENTFENQFHTAVLQQNSYNSEVSRNTITTNVTYSQYTGIYFYGCSGGNLITQNKITDLPRGIKFSVSSGTSAEPNLISNNFIEKVTGNRGIYIGTVYHINVYNNSVLVTSTDLSAAALSIVAGDNINIKNNILVNTGGGYAIYNYLYNNTANISSSDNNDLFATGTKFAKWTNSLLSDLSAWQSISGLDANSFSIDPLFVSETDLHIAEIDLNGAGTPLAEVTVDIDDEPRDPTMPDIGADEFNPASANDIGIEEIVTPSPEIPFPAQNQQVLVTLKNNGIDTIYTAIIPWSVNDNIQTSFNWTGELFPGERDTVSVGDYNFLPGIPYEIVAYTRQPNGLPDVLQVNDTTRVEDLYTGLSGVYTLGGNLEDFSSFEQAANALNKGGVLGPVEFLVSDGTYNEQVNIDVINGVDATNTVIFRSASGDPASVLLQHGSPHVIRLNGADYVTFENLSIDYTYYYSGTAVELTNGANNNQFLNNTFTAASSNAYNNYHIYSYTYTNSNLINYNNNNTIIRGNTFDQGNYGIHIEGQSASILETGTLIQDNVFTNQHKSAIKVYNQDAPQITGNLITTDEASSSFIGIDTRDTENGLDISNNEIYTNAGKGLYLYVCDGTPAQHILISNNFIKVGDEIPNPVNSFEYGIELYYGTYTDVYYNSVHVISAGEVDAACRAFLGSNRNIVNNIFVNSGGGPAIYSASSGFVSLDYNNLYATGSVLGRWDNIDAATLANWRQASGRGTNSISVDPLYVSDTDLHTMQIALDSTGTYLPTVLEDIDGEVRDGYFPDIGADEVSYLLNNVGVLSVINPVSGCGLPQNDSLVVTIKNYGTEAQSGFDVAYQIGTDNPVVETVSGTVNIGETLDYTFATPINFPADSTYEIITYTLLSNDQQLQNDTLEIQTTGYPAVVPMVVTPGQTICQGEGITLEAAGEGTFQWNGSYTNNQFYVSPSDTTTYTVVNTNQYGCTQEANIQVNVIPLPTVPTISATGGSFLICSGDTIELISSIDENIIWSTGDTTQSIITSTAGYYYVDHYDIVTNCYKRSNEIYVSIYEEPYLYVNGFTSICTGDSTTLLAYNGSDYQWSTGEISQSISVSPTVPTTYTVTMTNAGGCIRIDSVEITQVPTVPPGVVSGMLPADGTINLSAPINFSWLPGTNASDYDVYIWPVGNNRPAYPASQNVNGINVSYSDLTYGATYNWQVVSENSCYSTDGPIQTFTVKDPSNLIVENIEVLAAPFSGQTIGISWEVNNIGIGATGVNSNWIDRVYLSIDSTLGNSDISLQYVSNTSALMPEESYLNYASVNLSESAIGPYYILVKANSNETEIENDYSDNVTAIPINIALSPPPDLEVTNTLPPGVNGYSFSGQTIPLTYTVSNTGIGLTPSPNWQDRIYWSDESSYNPSNLNYLGYKNHLGSLQPGESYTTTKNVNLPANYSGTIYFYIVTDHYDAIFEHLDEDNNIGRSQPLDILLTPPPDLEVTAATIGETLTTQQGTSIAYTTINDGGSATTSPYWKDSLFLSPVMMLDSTAIPLADKSRFNFMEVSETNYSNINTTVPGVDAGTYYLIIKTDVTDNIYEGNNEENNTYVHASPITVLNPDLELIAASTPTNTIATGASVEVNWQVTNADIGNIFSIQRKDRIYVSENVAWDSTAVQVGELVWNNNVASGDIISQSMTVNIPVTFVEGAHYIHVVADAENTIFESDETNNTGVIPLQINVAPWADLVPQAFSTLPDSIFAGEPFPFGFTVKNNGIADADEATWKDEVYVSVLPMWYPEAAVLLTEYERFQPVAKDSTYTVETEISFPMLSLLVAGLDSFSYVYAYVFTDADSTIFEYNSENNNVLRSNPIHVTCPPPVDLNILSATTNMPDTVAEGSTFTLGWNVQNEGSTTANWNYEIWYDGLYLSTDMVYDEDDIFVYDWTESGPLGYNEDYDDYQSFTIPNGNYDAYYLLLVSDHTDLNNDGDSTNNVYVVNNLGGNDQIYVASTPKPDLEITAFSTPPSGIAGQPVTISWTVQNNGNAPVFIPFTEQFILDTNDDGSDGEPLGQYTKSDSLLVGESYTETMDFNLPISTSGNYYIVMKTEATNQIFELAGGEDNNIASAIIQVIPQTPSDLTIPTVSLAANTEVFVADTMTLDYVIKNIGTNPSEGVRKEIIYLSEDSLFNTNDPVLATIEYDETILPYQELTKTIDVAIPGVTPGEYFVIVSVDGFNNILETDETNNTASSVNKVNVTLPQLVIDIPENTVLTDNVYQYYALVVPDSLAGETLVISLESDGAVGNNELYLKYGEAPTLSNADYTYAIPFSTDQELIVETLQAGTYYLLVKGEVQPGEEQNITLLAEILPFEIRGIDAEQGGNTGNVTVRIDGAKFEPNMQVRLEGSMSVTASNTYFINSTRIFATFDLNGADLGVYDVVIDKGLEEATLTEGFEVVVGSFGTSEDSGNGSPGFFCDISYNEGVSNFLDQDLDYPSAVRRNRTVEINIYFRNDGNIDIPIPVRFLLSVSEHPVSADVAGLDDELQKLFLEFKEDGGPPGILRAGASGLVRAYTRSFSSGTFIELILAE